MRFATQTTATNATSPQAKSQLRAQRCRHWIKFSNHPLARGIFYCIQGTRQFELPMPKIVASGLFYAYRVVNNAVNTVLRAAFFTPMFKSRLQSCGTALYLYGGMPYLAGPLHIDIGKRCRISGKTTITGRTAQSRTPVLHIGSNVDIGWQTTIAVGASVHIGDNTRIAGQCFIAGYPGHPLEARARAEGKPEHDQQAQAIHIADDVWLGTGVTVLAGVSIGEGSVIGAGSVVTKNLPAGVIAAGNPAKVIRKIAE